MTYRPLTTQDVTEGAIVYLLDDDAVYHEKTIEEVLSPSDLFKGYVADDGCRYGLYEAYIAIDLSTLVHTVKVEIARHLHHSGDIQTEQELTKLLIKELQND